MGTDNKNDKEQDEIPLPCWVYTLRKRMKELEERGFLEEIRNADG